MGPFGVEGSGHFWGLGFGAFLGGFAGDCEVVNSSRLLGLDGFGALVEGCLGCAILGLTASAFGAAGVDFE